VPEFSGKSVKRLLRQAVRSLRTNQYDDAITFTNEVIERQPDNARAIALQFTTYYKSEQAEKAHAVGDKAAELNPASEYILNNQACLHLGVKAPDKAQNLLESLLEQYGKKAQWLYNLGLAYGQMENYHKAIQCFNNVIALEPDHHRALLQLSTAQKKLGLHEELSHSLNLLRLVTTNQPTTNACYLHHAIRCGLVSEESARIETSLWCEQFIPKNKSYAITPFQDEYSLKIAFVIGSIPLLEWSTIIKPLIDELAKLGNEIVIYWHIASVIPLIKTKNISIFNMRGVSDADFARRAYKDKNNVIVDIGGMNTQTRERALGLQIANKQYGWLIHTGMYSTEKVTLLDEKLKNKPFALSSIGTQVQQNKKLPKDTIAAIGCQSGLTFSTIEIWSEVLNSLPNIVLMLDVSTVAIQNQLLKRFALFNIKEEQLAFSDKIELTPGNLVLDNLTNNSIAKAGLAFLKGANLITLPGDLFPAQQTAKLLKQTGNQQWICEDKRSYVDLAIKLAKTQKKNTKLKLQIEKSGLLDMKKFANEFINQITDD
jgi:Tfp pilus assembly protein PilF